MNNLANKIANYFAAKGYRKGDIVGLVMENCPESICVWLGLCKVRNFWPCLETSTNFRTLSSNLHVGNVDWRH